MPQLGRVHVLELVDRHVAEATLPARPEDGVALQQVDGPNDEVVEVERAASGQQIGEDGERRQRVLRRRPPLHLPGGEERVELGRLGHRRRVRRRDRRATRRRAARSSGRRSATRWTGSPASSSTWRARAWRVRTSTRSAPGSSGPSRVAIRALSSSAASRLKVTTAIRSAGTPRVSSTPSRAMRVVVLPLPAGAMIWAGPSGRVAAARCSGSSASSRGATDGVAAWASAMRVRIGRASLTGA